MSAFGAFSAPKPPAQPTLWGSAAQPATTSAFGGFGQQSTQQTQPSTGLFGGFGQQQQQQPQQNQPAAPSTGLFGQPLNTQQQQQQQQPAQSAFGTSNIFGNSNQTQPQAGQVQQTQQPNPFTGFGSNANANTGQTNSGLFGSTTTANNNQQQQAGTGFGLFGSTTSAPAQANALGGFGSTNPFNPPQPVGTSFGLGGSTLGQTTQQSNQAQQSSAALFTKATKFNDLPDELKKKFEVIDAHIQGRVQISTELKQNKLGDEPVKGAEQIRIVHKDLVNAINNLRTDIASMRELRTKMDQAVQDTIIATRIIDASRNPGQQQASAYLKNYANFPLEFFSRIADQLRERLQWLNNTIEQIERKLSSEVNHVSITPQAISTTLQAQHASFVALANKTAALDSELQKLKTTYRQLWKARTGSARDPFNEHDRSSGTTSEFGLDGLSVQ